MPLTDEDEDEEEEEDCWAAATDAGVGGGGCGGKLGVEENGPTLGATWGDLAPGPADDAAAAPAGPHDGRGGDADADGCAGGAASLNLLTKWALKITR